MQKHLDLFTRTHTLLWVSLRLRLAVLTLKTYCLHILFLDPTLQSLTLLSVGNARPREVLSLRPSLWLQLPGFHLFLRCPQPLRSGRSCGQRPIPSALSRSKRTLNAARATISATARHQTSAQGS